MAVSRKSLRDNLRTAYLDRVIALFTADGEEVHHLGLRFPHEHEVHGIVNVQDGVELPDEISVEKARA